MKLSIVFAGRNDDYGGDFAERTLVAMRRNQIEAHQRGVECEWIFVEWNPLPDRGYLSYSLAALGAKCYIISPQIHARRVDGSTRMVFMQFHACNVGIRRATGDWILSTHPDDIIGPDTWNYLAKRELEQHKLYRARRYDVPLDWFGASFDEMNRHRGLDHGGGPTNAAGDFLLFSATGRFGYDEAVNYSDIHLDGRFVRNWVALRGGKGLDERFWQFIGTIYKADHPMIYRRTHNVADHHRGRRSWDSQRKTCDGPGLYRNPDNWGLIDEPEQEICRNIWHIGPD